MTRARALRTVPWVQAVFRPGARPRRVETGVRCRDCRDLRSPGTEAAGARRGLGADEGAGPLGDESGRGSSAARRRGSLGLLADEGAGARRELDVDQGHCRLRDDEGGGARRLLDVDEGGRGSSAAGLG